jgi:hypothetical protein
MQITGTRQLRFDGKAFQRAFNAHGDFGSTGNFIITKALHTFLGQLGSEHWNIKINDRYAYYSIHGSTDADNCRKFIIRQQFNPLNSR